MIAHPENWTAKSRAERDEAVVERLVNADENVLALAIAKKRHTKQTWMADDGNAAVEYHTDTAEEAAQEYVDDGDWDGDSTGCHTIYTWPVYYVGEVGVEDFTDRDTHEITVDPEEPECDDSGHEHDWCTPYAVLGGLRENPGVWAHDGGVICKEVCRHCGTLKTTDTWASNPSNGTPYTQVSYAALGAHNDSKAFEAWREGEEES